MKPNSRRYSVGMTLMFRLVSSFMLKGTETNMEKRNIHFIKVTTLYFAMMGLNTPRYVAKNKQLNIIKTMPKGLVCVTAEFPKLTLLRMSITTPVKLIATPPAFFKVIGSFNAMAAVNMVNIGVMAVMIAVSIGVVILMASRKLICVRNNPNIEAMKIFHKSLNGTLSFGKNSETIQKSNVAPMARKLKSPMGEMRQELVRSLQMMMLNPKIV